jgi:hypothetical protein
VILLVNSYEIVLDVSASRVIAIIKVSSYFFVVTPTKRGAGYEIGPDHARLSEEMTHADPRWCLRDYR